MQYSEDIIALINSLSRSEKRYFKLFSSRNRSENHYIKLFDLFCKTGTADEQAIKKLYKGEKFNAEQFRVYKHRLYEQILKSLNSYDSQQSADTILKELIGQASVLYRKAFYKSASNILLKAKKIALKNEKHVQLLDILHLEKKIIASMQYDGIDENRLLSLYETEEAIIGKIKNTNDYWKLCADMFRTYRAYGTAQARESIDFYHSLMNASLSGIKEEALTFEAKRNLYFAYISYSMGINDLAGSYTYSRKMIALLEDHPEQIEDNPGIYGSALSNFLYILKDIKNYKEFLANLSKTKDFLYKYRSKLTENLRSSVLFNFYNLEIAYYLDTGQSYKALALLPVIREEINTHQIKLSKLYELLFHSNIALIYFGMEDYHQSLISLHKVLNDTTKDLRHDIYSSARILQLILHFEIGNEDLLSYLVKSVYRELIKRKRLHEKEKVFIKFIRLRLPEIKNEKDQVEALKNLKEELVRIKQDDLSEIRSVEFFEIISWLESKIEKRSFEEILREKSGYVLEK